MSSSPLSDAIGFFVRAAEEILSQLDFASAVPGPNWKLGGRLHGLDCLLADLKSVAARRGLPGAETYLHAHEFKEQLSPAVQAHDDGNLDPWRSCRDRCREQLGTLLASCETISVANPVAVDQPARPKPARDLSQTQSEKGEEGEKPFVSPKPRTRNGWRVLRMLSENHAKSELDLVTRDYIADETGLSITKIRRALEDDLTPQGLIETKRGRDGGAWLSARGIAAAGDVRSK